MGEEVAYVLQVSIRVVATEGVCSCYCVEKTKNRSSYEDVPKRAKGDGEGEEMEEGYAVAHKEEGEGNREEEREE